MMVRRGKLKKLGEKPSGVTFRHHEIHGKSSGFELDFRGEKSSSNRLSYGLLLLLLLLLLQY
jgi:hypothetical protein